MVPKPLTVLKKGLSQFATVIKVGTYFLFSDFATDSEGRTAPDKGLLDREQSGVKWNKVRLILG